jgi:hypothetical protein
LKNSIKKNMTQQFKRNFQSQRSSLNESPSKFTRLQTLGSSKHLNIINKHNSVVNNNSSNQPMCPVTPIVRPMNMNIIESSTDSDLPAEEVIDNVIDTDRMSKKSLVKMGS